MHCTCPSSTPGQSGRVQKLKLKWYPCRLISKLSNQLKTNYELLREQFHVYPGQGGSFIWELCEEEVFLRQGSNSTWGRPLSSHNSAAAAHPSDPKGICTHSFELFHYKDPKCSSPSIHNHFLLPNMAKTLLESFSVSSALLTPKPNPGEEQSFGGTQRRGCHGLLSEHIERLFQDLKTFFTPITSKISWEFPSTFPGKEKPKHSFTSVDVKPLSFFFFGLVGYHLSSIQS